MTHIDVPVAPVEQSGADKAVRRADTEGYRSEVSDLSAEQLAVQTWGLALELDAADEVRKHWPAWFFALPSATSLDLSHERELAERAERFYERQRSNQESQSVAG